MKIYRKNDLSPRLLEIFGALMLHQTTVDAAAELGISQPAVSLALKQLERQLGFALFERRSKRLVPTDEARSLFREIEPLFDTMRSIESHVRDLRAGTKGSLRIIATPPLGHSIVPPALKTFLAARPGLSIHYDVMRMESVIAAVENGAAHVALVLGLEQHPAVSVRVLHKRDMVALVPRGHALSGQAVLSPRDALAHGFIGLDAVSRLGALLRAAFEAERVPYQPLLEVRYCHTSAVLANSGIGMAIVDAYTAQFVATFDLVPIPFRPRIEISACLLTRADRPLSRLAAEFIAEVEAVLVRLDPDPS